MSHDNRPDDDHSVLAAEIRWKLSQVRHCIPQIGRQRAPDRFDAESLLMLDLAESEHLRDEWARIAEVYRTLTEVAIEALALQEKKSRQYLALIKNLSDELTLRKQK